MFEKTSVLLLTFLARRQKNEFQVVAKIRKSSVGVSTEKFDSKAVPCLHRHHCVTFLINDGGTRGF